MSGYIDLQVNGYAGVDFNSDHITDDQVLTACQRIAQHGTDTFLATVITAPIEAMVARIRRLAQLIESNPEIASIMGGIHVEGPFINRAEGFVGAHPAAAVTEADCELAKRLVDAGGGFVRLFTLAPEMDAGAETTRWLTDQKIVVAAGHSDATCDQLQCSIDHGLKLFTHLGNGCPAQLHRHDNIIQRVLSLSDQIMVSFIADGHHVPTFALGNYFRCMPDEHIVIVTDAISAASLGPGRYELSDQIVEVDEHGAAWAEGRRHYAGCATTFPEMADILKTRLAIDESRIRKWMKDNPSKLLSSIA